MNFMRYTLILGFSFVLNIALAQLGPNIYLDPDGTPNMFIYPNCKLGDNSCEHNNWYKLKNGTLITVRYCIYSSMGEISVEKFKNDTLIEAGYALPAEFLSVEAVRSFDIDKMCISIVKDEYLQPRKHGLWLIYDPDKDKSYWTEYYKGVEISGACKD